MLCSACGYDIRTLHGGRNNVVNFLTIYSKTAKATGIVGRKYLYLAIYHVYNNW